MSMRFTAPLRFSPEPLNPAYGDATADPLGYALEPLAMRRQARFEGRLAITPEIDLSVYTCRAVIDWIWVEFETQATTQSLALSKHLEEALLGRRPIVTGPDAPHDARHCENVTGTRFRAKIQDPDPWSIFRLEALLQRYRGLVAPVQLIGMEVALDWRPLPKCFPADGFEQARWAMVGTLHRHHLPRVRRLDTPDADLRQVYEMPATRPGKKRERKTAFVIASPQSPKSPGSEPGRLVSDLDLENPLACRRVLRMEGHRAPYIDSTLYRGPKDGPVLFRIQDKVSDERNIWKGTEKVLSPEERRARLEVTLLGAAVAEAGLHELRDLFGFRFATLRKDHFACWLPTVPGTKSRDGSGPNRREEQLGQEMTRIFAESGVYGLTLYEAASRITGEGGRPALRLRDEEIELPAWLVSGGSGHLLAWEEMNHRASRALQRLTQRWGPEPMERELALIRSVVAASADRRRAREVGEGDELADAEPGVG